MKKFAVIFAYCLSSVAGYSLDYPATPQVSSADVYHGVEVEDPFRWLEDSEDPLVQEWDRKQQDFFEKHQKSNSYRKPLYDSLRALFASEKTETIEIGPEGRLLTSFQQPDQHAPIFYTQKSTGAPLELLLDVNKWEGEHTVEFFEPSPDGRFIAFGVAQGGDESPMIYLVDVVAGQHIETKLSGWHQMDVVWHPNSIGFYYTANPKKGEVPPGEEYFWPAVYYHALGASEEIVILEDKVLKEWWYVLSADENTLYIWRYRNAEILGSITAEGFSQPFDNPHAAVEKIYTKLEGEESYRYYVIGGETYLLTNLAAENFQLLRFREGVCTEVIGEKEDILIDVAGINGRLAATYRQHGHYCIRIFDINGTFLKKIPLPGPGIAHLDGEWNSSTGYLAFNSLTQPWTLYRYNEEKNTLIEKYSAPVPGYNPEAYETKLLFVQSADGTQVPVHVALRKGFSRGVAFLTGYGGFDISVEPSFNPQNLPWLKSNGVVCVAHLRGGGEYGDKWHKGGMRENKQRVYDDFIAAAEMLIRDYASPGKLAICGGSNGGLLTGAVTVQRPDLFRAVVVGVPLLDMLRFHQFRLGYLWTVEYGSSAREDQFRYLYEYSPYHHVVPGIEYPSVLITTGLNDYRVDPLHARKMAAMLQFADPEGKPHFLNIDFNGGHRAYSHLNRCRRFSDEHSFLMQQIGVTLKQGEIPDIQLQAKGFAERLRMEQKEDDYQEKAKYRTILRKMKKGRPILPERAV